MPKPIIKAITNSADVVVGTTQRFGIPMRYGGPHAGYFATTEKYKRNIPGRIIGVSIDDSFSHKKFAEKYNLPFPLLSDTSGDVANSYGALNNFLVIKLAKRYTYLISPQGKIAKIYLSVDTSKHSQEIIEDLKILK